MQPAFSLPFVTLPRGSRPGCALALAAVVPALVLITERLPPEQLALPVGRSPLPYLCKRMKCRLAPWFFSSCACFARAPFTATRSRSGSTFFPTDALRVEEGSLYPALQKILLKGWVSATWGVSETNRKVRFYKLTRDGMKQLERMRSSTVTVRGAARSSVADARRIASNRAAFRRRNTPAI